MTSVEGDLKAPFSIATIMSCKWGTILFPWLLHFTLDPYLTVMSAKLGDIKYHVLSLLYDSTWDWISISWTIGEHFTH